ncbi:MAG: cytochrome c [Rhodobacteraceae bacterium]|nr:cytochrome c [Paracoccaceae bacterium]
MEELGDLVAGVDYKPNHYAEGTAIYIANCVFCHGVPAVDGGGNVPNLGYSSCGNLAGLEGVLLSAAYEDAAMPSFEGKPNSDEIARITAFTQGTADAVRPK